MTTRYPLFARLLVWFFVNLLVLVAGLLLMMRLQFGSLDNLLLPASSQAQIQAMSQTLIGNLTHTPRSDWDGELAQVSSAYKMEFALYDTHGQRLKGATLQLPEDIFQALLLATPNRPPRPEPGAGPGMPPPQGASNFNPQPDEPRPQDQPDRPPPPPRRDLPEFPKSVLHSTAPPAYWLLVRLPPEPFQSPTPITLVGMTPSLGASPLLFNPKPWLAVVAGIVVFSILFWLPLARNLTRSITEMTRATESIAEGRFDVQLADKRRDELGRLSHAINRMAARLKAFVTGQKRFLGDAAHELCSPLARMEIALGILEERGDEKMLPLLQDVREEVTHMQKLANELLSFSKASLLERSVELEAVSVIYVVEGAVRQEKHGAFPIEIRVPADLRVRGNAELLQRALANLLRNALRYGGGVGVITVRAWSERERVIVTVSDEGPGITTGELDKIFDPFYRVDPSRTQATGGVGLGLAIVKTSVEACGGTVGASNREPHGLEVKLSLVRTH